jgi:hypothetical protein
MIMMEESRSRQMILNGEEPYWRMAWELSLEPGQRSTVNEAVRHGTLVDDPRLAIFAVGLAEKSLRRSRWLTLALLLHSTVNAGWIYIACFLEGSQLHSSIWCSFWVVIGLALITLVPRRLMRAKRRYELARRVNRTLL